MIDFILLFLVYTWVLFFDGVCRFLTILTQHLTFNEPEIKFPRPTLIHHDHRTREERRMLRQRPPQAARGGSITLMFSFSLEFVAVIARVSS